jgi:hypothetical protein
VRLGLENMRRHGVDAPMFHQTAYGERSMSTEKVRSYFDDFMRMMREIGYPQDRFFYCANVPDLIYPGLDKPFWNYWRSNKEQAEKRFRWVPGIRPRAAVHLNYAEEITKFILEFKAKAEAHGFREFWFYVADEVMRHELPVIYPVSVEYRKTGVKTYLTTSQSRFIDDKGRINEALWRQTLRSVDGITFPRALNAKLAALARAGGVRVYSYNNPQLGQEQPHTYRRNYGLALWKAGYAGGMDFCYAESDWNDFSDREYRDHNMVYPSGDRMVDTLQWEGYREGVDDVRYLSTLLKAIEKAQEIEALAKQAAAAKRWVQSINVTDTLGWDGFREGVDDADLDRLRRKIAVWIVKLSREIESARQ